MTPGRDEEGVFLELQEPGGSRAVVIEDDGRVAYAYLLEEGKIVGDVWLYNVAPAPERIERSDEPPLNPRRFCRDDAALRVGAGSTVTCVWSEGGVDVLVDDVRVARLARDAKPGWARAAAKAGPLAKPLDPG